MSFSLRKKFIPLADSENTVKISFLVCDELERAGFLHAFSTRHGGVSPMPKEALHLSPKKDSKENYEENLRRFLLAIRADGWRLATTNQTHSDKRIVVTSPFRERSAPAPHGGRVRVNMDASLTPALSLKGEGDALITGEAHTLIGVKTADCLPILIADPKSKVTAVVHAGWRGTLQRIAEKTVGDLKEKFGVKPKDLVAALGPSACGECYEVGPEVVDAFKGEFKVAEAFFHDRKGKTHLDVSAANRHQLAVAGLDPHHIYSDAHCTMHQNDLFFSHRREGHLHAGRLLSVIGRVA